MRESDVEKYLVKRAKEFGAEIRKVKWIGRRGAPDRRFMHSACCCWIELKAPGEKLEPHQEREIKLMRKHDETVWVLSSIEEVDHFYEILSRLAWLS